MFKQLTGHLGYLDFPSKVGLYYDEGKAVLVDAGLDARTGRKVHAELQRLQLEPEALIITHAHADHFGGAAELKRLNPKLTVYASLSEQSVLMVPEYEPYYLYGAEPLKDLRNKFLQGERVEVDRVLNPGERLTLVGSEWEVLDLSGHTPGQIGLMLPAEQTVWIADAVFAEEVIHKYRLIYHFGLKGAIATLQKLERLALEGVYKLFIPGHGEPYSSLQSVILSNLGAINETLELTQGELAKKPHTREGMVALIMNEYQIQHTVSQYFLTFSAVSAYLSYLVAEKAADVEVRSGELYFISR